MDPTDPTESRRRRFNALIVTDAAVDPPSPSPPPSTVLVYGVAACGGGGAAGESTPPAEGSAKEGSVGSVGVEDSSEDVNGSDAVIVVVVRDGCSVWVFATCCTICVYRQLVNRNTGGRVEGKKERRERANVVSTLMSALSCSQCSHYHGIMVSVFQCKTFSGVLWRSLAFSASGVL